ncbi:PAS domain-containing protein [Hymenobacter sp. ASUV-10]|uniref:histidine kinase n=1 Tax=Hymenobacter aranciens TaxID=3063996 RepID=A0ABT9BF97_9BACT|nr:PAS domain-containing protein [Hymenobacter sp. ASUV-10]MDO7876930.1 PAS domain-containing protein [Hymenobacter sp. ASUV-10]
MTSVPTPAASSDDDLLTALLDVSLTGVILFRPVYAADGRTIRDLAYDYLNPSAQRMLALPERPTDTFLTLYPSAIEAGIFAFYRDTFLSGEAGRYNVNYQHDGLDNYFHLAARRSGGQLVVSFTDTADHDRTAAEHALRESQARERAAWAEAERQRQQLYRMFEQAPAMICIFDGPQHVFQFVNPPYQALVGDRPIIGKPIAEAMPELAGQPIFALLDRVYQTGEPFFATEMLVQLDHHNEGLQNLEKRYYNFTYQARRDAQGTIDGILVFAYEVTPQVVARQQTQLLNDELARTNEALEARVAERTRSAQQAQAEAERQRARLERFFMQAPAGICILDGPEMVFELVNPGYQQIFPTRQLQGLPILAAMPEIADQPVYAMLRRVYASGRTNEEQEELVQFTRPEDGVVEDRYFNFIQQARYDEAGQIDGLLVFVFEVTSSVQARLRNEALQAELLASAQRLVQERETYYQVFEQTPAALAILRGPEHRMEYFNEAYQQLFPDRRMHGRTIAEMQPESSEQGFVALLDRVYQTGETYYGNELPLSVAQPDGQPPRTFYFNFTYQPFREAGAVVGISVFAYDVTGQTLARQQRAQQQRQLNDLFEQAPVAICVFEGEEYQLEVLNSEMGALLGYSPAQVVGQPFFEALPELGGQGLRELLDEVRRTGVPFVAHEREIKTAQHQPGETGFYDFVYQPLRQPDGRFTSVIVVANDVTEQVLARRQVQELNEELAVINEELAATNEELQASNDELGSTNNRLTRTNADLDTFVYTASHDLKAPITNIEGLLHTLLAELPPTNRPGDVNMILDLMQGAVDRFRTTIGHLTDVSRVQQAQDYHPEPVRLADVIRDVRLDLAPMLAETSATLLVDVEACPTVSFSVKNLRSIIYNLVSNALKYRHPDRHPEIRITCRPGADYTALLVADNGLGITAAQQPRIFSMFQRFHTHVEGSGIGLYMVKKMVGNAGGYIVVDSALGEGSTFSIFFPR